MSDGERLKDLLLVQHSTKEERWPKCEATLILRNKNRNIKGIQIVIVIWSVEINNNL